MRALPAILLVGLFQGNCTLAAAPSVEQCVQEVFSELRSLQFMEGGQRYTVRVAGAVEPGPKEQFLRRRTAGEISESGLSCGCGDNAILFIGRIEPMGFQTLLVDGAEVSLNSLQNHFSGHAVVAIRTRSDAHWWLVDSTNLKIISRHWAPTEKYFDAFGRSFWIGYCGPVANHPVHGPDGLKAFYARTLEEVPPAFLNQTMIQLKFTVDTSLVGSDGKFLNPRLDGFLKIQGEMFEAYHIQPLKEVPVRLTRGEDNAESDLKFSESEGWVGRVGLKSYCSPGLLDYFDQATRNRKLREVQSGS